MPRGRHTRRDPKRPAVVRVLWTVLLSLALGAVVTGDRLGESARSLEYGPLRQVAVVAAAPAEWANHIVQIDLVRDRLRPWVLALLEPGEPDMHEPSERSGPGTLAEEPPAAPEPTSTSEPPAAPPSREPTPPALMYRNLHPTAKSPLRVTIDGDSMIEALGKYLKAELIETGRARADYDVRYSSGLSRPDFFDWPKHLTSLIADEDSDVTVLMLGANDGQPMVVDGKQLSYGTPEWKVEYARRVALVMRIGAADGRRLYWVGLPIARSSTYSAKCATINAIYQAEAAKHEGVQYVDTWKLFAAPDGTYSAYLKDASGKTRLMRGEDGIHLSVAGAHRLTDRLMEIIGEDYRLADKQ